MRLCGSVRPRGADHMTCQIFIIHRLQTKPTDYSTLSNIKFSLVYLILDQISKLTYMLTMFDLTPRNSELPQSEFYQFFRKYLVEFGPSVSVFQSDCRLGSGNLQFLNLLTG